MTFLSDIYVRQHHINPVVPWLRLYKPSYYPLTNTCITMFFACTEHCSSISYHHIGLHWHTLLHQFTKAPASSCHPRGQLYQVYHHHHILVVFGGWHYHDFSFFHLLQQTQLYTHQPSERASREHG